MKDLWMALKVFMVLTLATGIVYPVMVTAVAQAGFNKAANGSLSVKNDQVVGSELLAQKFEDAKYFWPRPSAVDYNAMSSGASQLGPITQGRQWSSGSGLDPHISLKEAVQQLERIASNRKWSETQVMQAMKMLTDTLEKRDFHFLGEERVNVLKLNMKIDEVL